MNPPAGRSPKLVFVAGCGHSGTSLVAAMLGAHSKIYTIPEETNCLLRSNHQGIDDGQKRQRLAAYVERRDKRDVDYVCEKTPGHIRCFDDALRFYPDCKLIVVFRDPRDVAASYKRRGLSVEGSVEMWRKAAKRYGQWKAQGLPIMPIFFERLVTNPEQTLNPVCNFLDIAWEQNLLDFWKDGRSWYRGGGGGTNANGGHRDLRNWQLHQPLMADRIGNYAKDLTPEEVQTVSSKLASTAAKYGYAIKEQVVPHQQTRAMLHSL